MDAGDGSSRSIINRSYYAMFYAVLAFLLRKGKAYKKHSGVIGAFESLFVRTGLLPKPPNGALPATQQKQQHLSKKWDCLRRT